MKIHRELEQKSWDWFQARAGKVTGSELGNLITDKGKIRSWASAMPNSYLHRKLAEKWRGEPLQSFQGNQQTDQGIMHEEKARRYFASLLEADIETIGGIESDDGALWCSPDGLIGETTGLEIKCPNADTHVGWLLAGGQIPEEHFLQVQFALFVSGFGQWRFLSYCKDMPHIAAWEEPNNGTIGTINDALGEFQTRLAAGWQQLCEMNGGAPTPKPRLKPIPMKFADDIAAGRTEDYEDVTP